MKLNDFRKIINQYLKGVSSHDSRKKVETFLKLSYKRSPFKSARLSNQREDLKAELWGGIQSEIEGKARKRRHLLKVAAVITLLVAAGAFLHKADLVSFNNPQMIVVKTGAAQKRTITLADGTIVKMNANSMLTFAEKFESASREVKLTGEAFFDVRKNPSKPFIVTSGNIETTVLGTEFNIRAYAGEDIDVTVTEGKVKVAETVEKSGAPAKSVLLVPGQQALFVKADGNLTRREVDTRIYTGWQEEEFNFKSVPFEEVLAILERAYNTKIELTSDSSKEKCLVKARFRNKDLESILKGLQRLISFGYEYQGSKLIIHYNGCSTP